MTSGVSKASMAELGRRLDPLVTGDLALDKEEVMASVAWIETHLDVSPNKSMSTAADEATKRAASAWKFNR
jgi:hypothetical protein